MMGWRARLLGRGEDEVRPSIEKRIEAGTVIFRAGDRCDAVALIHDGEVELLADRDGQTVQVGTRRRGAVVGGDVLLGDGVWRHTARTLRQTRIEMLARDVFIERFADQSAAILTAAAESWAARLLPGSPASVSAMPPEGVDITEFPFVVGRASSGSCASPSRPRALVLEDRRPYHLSRRQFVIVQDADGIGIADPGSRLGTFVDGHRLGPEPMPLAPDRGVDIIAGGKQSPFRFHLQLH